MRSGGNDFNYFSEKKLTKLANSVQFKRMLMFLFWMIGRGRVWAPWAPFVYATRAHRDRQKRQPLMRVWNGLSLNLKVFCTFWYKKKQTPGPPLSTCCLHNGDYYIVSYRLIVLK